mmetsp:Transcript_107494/g.213463  ORF Transcript_107494/g.213463 Transcript_107494/m.213463 type:complete len:236 (-) Transcript_107494:405-1112(-)
MRVVSKTSRETQKTRFVYSELREILAWSLQAACPASASSLPQKVENSAYCFCCAAFSARNSVHCSQVPSWSTDTAAMLHWQPAPQSHSAQRHFSFAQMPMLTPPLNASFFWILSVAFAPACDASSSFMMDSFEFSDEAPRLTDRPSVLSVGLACSLHPPSSQPPEETAGAAGAHGLQPPQPPPLAPAQTAGALIAVKFSALTLMVCLLERPTTQRPLSPAASTHMPCFPFNSGAP